MIPPGVAGVSGGALWCALDSTARQIEAGGHVDARAGRRRGLRQMLIWASETLGTNGSIAAGVLLLLPVIGRATMRIVRRPERTVWMPEAA